MTAITINRMHTRMRIPPAAMAEQARLKGVVASAVDRVLESAIERQGISAHGYLCIRQVQATMRLRLCQPDSVLAGIVAQAIADAIPEAQRGESSIYYSSRTHALIDLASSAMRADLERSWAWIQLGIWHDDARRSFATAAEQVIRALADEPQHAVAALAYLASDGSTLSALLGWTDPNAWFRLAVAACKAYGASVEITEANHTVVPSALADEIGGRIVQRSRIARALTAASMPRLPNTVLVAFAALVVLEVEPASMRFSRAPARTLLDPVVTCLERSAERDEAPRTSPPAPSETRGTHQNSVGTVLLTSETEPISNGVSTSEQAPHLADVRLIAQTSAGGLMYLLNLIARTDLPDRVMHDHRLTQRGLRWTLHQLAIGLLALAPDDPAALAFAGLLSDNSPPNLGQEMLNEAELQAIDECRAALLADLRAAMGDRLALADSSDQALIDFVCRRDARIACDPGWIEVHFALEDVSNEIRFAGLDLDPGWIPWLGVVVRFIYA
ncbi:MAG: hypothetical protein ACXVJT_11980 [Thermoanaerobaculia bacterium]